MRNIFHERFASAILIIYSLIILFRAFETTLIIHHYGFDSRMVSSELFGIIPDILGASVFIIPYVLASFLLSKFSINILRVLNISLLLISTLIFLLIIKYFLYQLIPLDIFLYQYSIREILFTISTSSTNFFQTTIGFVLFLMTALFLAWGIGKVRINRFGTGILYSIVVLSLPIFFLTNSLFESKTDKFSLNKPVYFIGKSINYLSGRKQTARADVTEFKKLYPQKKFISEEYPLVYESVRDNELGKYFKDFNSSPNIVILIVEGLNDDFIHEYKGAFLMPFLSQLKSKSLYWRKCFTLGERSFAAVPGILGGLPYGEIGFTLLERLPRHLSLVSILNSNDYYTSFFYGQGSWFHQKDRFFKHNDIDLIVDNGKFSDEYAKIIVGEDNFFWGYNDKDLFNQSLRVIDTLNQNPRLDIYFTGTSHSPYVINNEEYYSSKLKELVTEPYTEFYQVYSKYIKSVLFVDDALKEFFDEYKKRPDYENTIFVITGDHPMTEIPIENSLKRYHVPLLIFSEKIHEAHSFTHTVSHLDIPEAILSILQNNLTHIPSISTSLGGELIYNEKTSPKNLAFMNDNREVIDFLSGDYYLAGEKLYRVDSLIKIKEIENDSIKSALKENLNVFTNTSLYVSRSDKIISNEDYCRELRFQNIFSYQNPDSIATSSVYHNLADNINLPNSDFVFDMSLNISPVKSEDISIVYQLTNSNDSILLWKNFGISEGKITQVHIPVSKLQVEDSIVHFKSYIWNQGNHNFTISNLNILIYSSEQTKSKNVAQ